MRYTEYGLKITLDELQYILNCAQNGVKYDSMEESVYIEGGDRPKIIQYCCYAECMPVNHTYLSR